MTVKCPNCGREFASENRHPWIVSDKAPPAEPDSGVRKQDLVEEFKRNHHNPIVAQLNQRIRELEEPDAPSDHVEAV